MNDIYRAIVDGKVVFEVQVQPGINHDDAWRGALKAYEDNKKSSV